MSEEKIEYVAGKKVKSDYLKLQINEQFYKLHYRSFSIVRKLGPTFNFYLYMVDNITEGYGKYQWWNKNVYPYFQNGELPFAKHQSFIADDLEITQGRVSQHLKLLQDYGIIKKIDTLNFTEKRKMDIYSLGTWADTGKGQVRSYYLAEITFNKE